MVYVQVCDMKGNPIDFNEMNTGIESVDGIFMSINDAVTAVEKLDPEYDYILQLEEEGHITADHIRIFDEFVQIPENRRNIRFTSNKAIIRAIRFKPYTSALFGDSVEIGTLFNGTVQEQLTGYKIFYERDNERSPELHQLHKSRNANVLAAGLIEEYIHNVQSTNPLSDLLGQIKGVTSNFQILLSIFYLADYFDAIKMKINELDLILIQENIPKRFLPLTKEMYVQELLEDLVPGKKKIYQVNIKTLQFLQSMKANKYVSDAGAATGYRDFLHKFLGIITENIWVHRQILKKLMKIDVVSESLYSAYLQTVDVWLLEAQLLVNQLSYYLHRMKNPSALLEGENSSELLLNIATQALQGPRATPFKEALIAFLNERCPKKIPEDSVIKNNDLIAHLRNYTSKCPDADYALIRFMKNNTDTINAIQTSLSITSSIASITASTTSILKFFGAI